MSWISQNVRPKDQIEKIKWKASKKPLLLKDDGELEERKEDKPDTYRTKKRKEEHVEEDKQLEIEQENEMKKLEKFLFGSLYSPVEFGKQDDEESRDEIIEKSSVLFFTDSSANSVLSIYENDVEFPENTDDEEGVRQRKPVWVDEKEEKISINIARVNKLRKLRKEENESVISGSSYVSRLRAQHVKLNSGTEWAQLDLQSRTYSFDDEDSDVENGPAGPALGLGRGRFFYSFDLVKAEVDKIGPLIGREERSLEVFEVSHDSKTIAFVGNEGSNLLQKISWISQNVHPKDQIEKIKRKASKKPLLLKDDGELEERKEDKPDTYKTKKRKEEHVEEDKQLEIEQENEMKKLEKFLFGSLYSPVEFGKQDDEESRDEIIEKSSVLFFTDRSANNVLSIYENDAEFPENTDDEEGVRQRKPVWVDEQEEKISINIARVNKLKKLRKEENESVISVKAYSFDDEDSDVENGPTGPALGLGYKDIEGIDDVLRTNEDLVVKSDAKLLPGLLEYSRLVNANTEDPSSGPINSVQFHRNTQLLLTGGLDQKLTFFQIYGKRNTKIQSIFLEDCPVQKASSVPDGSQVLVAGGKRFFYSFDPVKTEVDKIGPLIGREETSLEVFEVSHDSKTIAFVGNEGSANSVLSIYENDAELPENTDDEEGVRQRKPVWVDEQEEKISINIARVNKLRKLRKEENESVISGSSYVSRLRAQHVKPNSGTEWAQLDLQSRTYSFDDEDSDVENGPTGPALGLGYKDMEGIDDIL
ncbi:hypothetical protein U1Q18_039996 [Sarracenia purpurea var. burkii]